MGWQIIFVDAGKRLRNGGLTKLSSAKDAEQEAWERAAIHDSLAKDSNDKILNIVCAKIH